MKTLKRIAELTAAGLLATGLVCAAAVTFLLPDYQARIVKEWNAELDTVIVEDGIDASEAGTIMSIYSAEFISGCGGPAAPMLVADTWVSQLYIGAAGQLSQQFVRVDVHTGAVSSTLGPTFPRLLLLKTSIAWGFAWRRISWIDELSLTNGGGETLTLDATARYIHTRIDSANHAST